MAPAYLSTYLTILIYISSNSLCCDLSIDLVMDVLCAVLSDFLLWLEIVFDVTYVLRVQCKMAYRNRYLEGTDNGQMTQCGYPTFNSYIKNLCFSLGQTDRWTDRWTEKLIRGGAG
jgi:hypothetical protein